jgi:hypothetical protein
MDGSLGYNNPSEIALVEARRLWPAHKQFCLVSIGAGRQREMSLIVEPDGHRSFMNRISNPIIPIITSFIPGRRKLSLTTGVVPLTKLANSLALLATNSQQVHQKLLRSSDDLELGFPYFRFDPDREVGDIGLEEWEKAAVLKLVEHTRRYLEERETEKAKSRCVDYLINPPSTVLDRKLPLSSKLTVRS